MYNFALKNYYFHKSLYFLKNGFYVYFPKNNPVTKHAAEKSFSRMHVSYQKLLFY